MSDPHKKALKTALADQGEEKPKITFFEIEMWGWICPNCQQTNSIEDDPAYEESVTCFDCGEEYPTGN